ncbi:hypothetical protein J7I85_22065 [Arthrobacter sp. ISL-65]|nr:hypothetical protein [Arthrobacter sp. ISL-65]
MSHDKITFDRYGLTLVGNLFTPENLDEKGSFPAVIVQGSFSSVKEQCPTVTYLTDQPFVSAVGMMGICTSASNGVYLAAEDPRLKGFATIAGFVADARRTFEETGEPTTIPVYSETDENAVNYRPVRGAYDYCTSPQRGNVPAYVNRFDVRSWDTWLKLDPGLTVWSPAPG